MLSSGHARVGQAGPPKHTHGSTGPWQGGSHTALLAQRLGHVWASAHDRTGLTSPAS